MTQELRNMKLQRDALLLNRGAAWQAWPAAWRLVAGRIPAARQRVKVHLPTTDGRELGFACHTRPEQDQKRLWPPSSPRITAKGQLEEEWFWCGLLRAEFDLTTPGAVPPLQLRKSG